MQKLGTAYTVYYNRRHRWHGHLLDGRFKAKLVEEDEYLLKLSRYVHLNPVRVGRWKKRSVSEQIAYLRRYRWSSYLDYIQNTGESGLTRSHKDTEKSTGLISVGSVTPCENLRQFSNALKSGLLLSVLLDGIVGAQGSLARLGVIDDRLGIISAQYDSGI